MSNPFEFSTITQKNHIVQFLPCGPCELALRNNFRCLWPIKLFNCKNCAKCDKGFKIGTYKAYNLKIKVNFGGNSRIFCFCSYAIVAASDKGHFTEEEILENCFYLTSRIKRNQWKELTKL